MVINLSVVMFCIITANNIEVKTKVHDTHEWISKCHMALTEHNFKNPNDKCFCVEVSNVQGK